MEKRILVAYTSESGSTEQVAQKIGDVFVQSEGDYRNWDAIQT